MPSLLDQKSEERAIRDAYRADYAERSPEKRRAFASRLIQAAVESRSNLAQRYVLLREARDVAAQAGSAKLALAAVEEMAKTFAIDPTTSRRSALDAAAKGARSPLDFKEAAEGYLSAAAASLAPGEYGEAKRCMKAAASAAGPASDPAIAGAVRDLGADLAEISKRYASAKDPGKTKAADGNGGACTGKFLCYALDRWKEGLPLLAAATDGNFKELCLLDLSCPSDAKFQVVVGDRWIKASERCQGVERSAMILRGAGWLATAYPDLDVVGRTAVLKRLEALAADTPSSRFSWLGKDAIPGFVAKRYNGKDTRGWVPLVGTWRAARDAMVGEGVPRIGFHRFVRSSAAARWISVRFEFYGGNPGLYFPSSPDALGGPGVTLDRDGKRNPEVHQDIDMNRWNVVQVDFLKDQGQVTLNGAAVYRFSLTGPTYVLVRAHYDEVRIRKLFAFGYNSEKSW